MKKLILAAFLGIYAAAPQFAQTIKQEINAQNLKVNFLRMPAPSYAWDFSGGLYISGNTRIDQDINSQFVIISNNQELRNYDTSLKNGKYMSATLPTSIVLMSNASRNLFAYSDAKNNVYINDYVGIKYHSIANKKAVEAIAIGGYLAVATKNDANKSTINLYSHDTKGIKLTHSFVGHNEKVATLMFSEGDANLLSCTAEEIIIWDTETGKSLHRFVPDALKPISNTRKVAVSNNANIIAYCSFSKIIMVNLDSKKSSEIKVKTLPNDLRLSKDGQFLYTADKGVFIKYSTATGKVIEEIDVKNPNTVCQLSPNGLYSLLIPTEGTLLQVIQLDWK